VEFNDTGRGIGPDAVSRIFEPFFTTKTSGTGLGLAICHELVRAHGGEIQVTSAEGHGTSIRILLPVREDNGPMGTA
jgi:signal transduction histidine kinase